MLTRQLTLEALETREVPASDLLYVKQLSVAALGSEAVTRVAADPIGNVYVAGTFAGSVDLDPGAGTAKVTSTGGTDVFVAKYSYTGEYLWGKAVGGLGNETAADVAFDSGGNAYVVGTFNGLVDFDPGQATARYQAANDGSAFLWKLDFLGNYFGADTVSGKSRATSVAVDTRGNVVVAGQYYGYADFENAPERTVGLATTNPLGASFFWKVDRGGRTVWANELEATGKIETNAVAVDGAGNIYAGGAATGVVDFDTRPANSYFVNFGATRSAFAVKLSTTGETSWAQNVSGTSEVTGLGIDGQGNVTLGGNFSGRANFSTTPLNGILDSAGGQDGFAWRLSAAGNFLWARGFGGASEDSVTDVNVNRTGQALFVGTFKGTADFDPSAARLTLASTQTNGYLLKLSSLGFLSYAARLGRPSSPTLPTGVWGDTAGNAHVVGTFEGTNDFDPTEAVNELKASNGSTFLAKYYLTFLTPPRGNDPLETPNNNGVSAGSGYTISEGQGLTLQATANGLESAVFSWDINGDGQFDDARGMYVVLNPQQMIALGLGDSKATPINVRVRVSDGINPFIEAKTTLTINNIAPVAHFLSPPRIRVGIGPALTLQSVSDPSRTDGQAGFRYSFDFDNDGKFDLGNGQTYSGSSVLSNIQAPRGLFRQLGPRTIRIRVFDKDNGYSDSLVNITVFDGPIQLRFR